MTAAKKPTGAPSWIAHWHTLSPKAKAALIDALGFPAGSQDPQLLKCMQRVEYWLGFYPGGVAAIDNEPSTSVYVRELTAVRNACLALTELFVGGINQFTRETLSAHFLEPDWVTEPDASDAIEKADHAVLNLALACNSALKALAIETKSGRGRRKAGAREVVLTKLLELYRDYSKRLYEKRVRKGAVVRISAFETHELKFIRAAFGDIGADTFSDAIDPDNADAIDPDKHANTQWLELIQPLRHSSAKLRARAAQAVEPRPEK